MPRLTGRAKSFAVASAASSAFVATIFLSISNPSSQPTALRSLSEPRQTSTTAVTMPPTSEITQPSTTLVPPTTAPPAVVASPATAPTTAAPHPGPVAAASAVGLSVQERGELALSQINYPIAATKYSVVFEGPLDGILGVTDNSNNTITIYVRDGQTTASIARVIGHELGHAVDFSSLTWAERATYMSVRGITADSWYPCNMCEDYASPAGDFAETFAYWLLGPGDFRSMIAGEPSQEQLAALAPIFSP